MRWVVQWVASERSAQSRVPPAFWYMSLAGGLITLAYAIYRQDPVFIAGQSIGALVYLRNLMLLHQSSRSATATASESSPLAHSDPTIAHSKSQAIGTPRCDG